MQRLSWKERRDELCNLIKFVSDSYGGDDVAWLREYAKEVVETYKDDLGTAIDCFGLCSSFKRSSIMDERRPVKANVCGVCGRVPPFCYDSMDGVCSNK